MNFFPQNFYVWVLFRTFTMSQLFGCIGPLTHKPLRMTLTTLAIGYLLLAAAELAPRFMKNKENAGLISFALALLSLAIFAASLLDTIYPKQ